MSKERDIILSPTFVEWAEKVLKAHREGFTPIFPNEVATATLILMGILTTGDQVSYHKHLITGVNYDEAERLQHASGAEHIPVDGTEVRQESNQGNR